MRVLYLYVLICLSVSQCAYSQPRAFKWNEEVGDKYVGVNLSTSRYCGDLSERYNLSHLQLGWGVEAQARYRFKEQWCLFSNVGIYQVHADQRYVESLTNHLSFSATNFSAIVNLQWDFRAIDYNQNNIIYLFAGPGITKLSPSTVLNGTTYFLPDFRTEGNKYPLWVMQLNYGMGVPFTINPSAQLRLEGRYTHVLSDYLDDVSATYTDKSAASDVEKKLADKRLAENLVPNQIGAARGNSKKNDGYFLLTLQLIYKF